jgi:hypothetical protein
MTEQTSCLLVGWLMTRWLLVGWLLVGWLLVGWLRDDRRPDPGGVVP